MKSDLLSRRVPSNQLRIDQQLPLLGAGLSHLLQEHAGQQFAEALHGLLHRGQLGVGHLVQKHPVEANHAKIAGNSAAVLHDGAHHADGQAVAGADEARVPGELGPVGIDELLRLVAVVTHAVDLRQFLVLLQGVDVARLTRILEGLLDVDAEEHQRLVVLRQGVFGGHRGTGLVVGVDEIVAVVVLAKNHRRLGQRVDQRQVGGPGAGDDEAIGRVALAKAFAFGDQLQCVAALVEPLGDAEQQAHVIGLGGIDVLQDDELDHVGAVVGQRLGRRVGLVIQGGHRRLHQLAQLGSHLLRVVNDTRDGHFGDIRLLGHIR